MKKYTLLFITLLTLTATGFNIAPAYAWNPFGDACQELENANISDNEKADSIACNTKTTTNPVSGPNGVLMSITNAIALVAGIIAVIIIIIGGLQFVTSGGDSSKSTNARRAIIYAVVGIVVIVIARSIVAFVITKMV